MPSRHPRTPKLPLVSLALAMGIAAFPSPRQAEAAAANPGANCEATASRELRACVKRLGNVGRRCYLGTGAACAADDRRIVGALDKLERQVLNRCPDAATLGAAGYPAALDGGGLAQRLREACLGASATLAARAFGGPQGAVISRSFAGDRVCLDHASRAATMLVDRSFRLQSDCVRKAHRGRECDLGKTTSRIAREETRARERIAAKCADLARLVAIDTPTFVARGAAQARCLVATAHGDTGPLDLDCGPRDAVAVPARGAATQVVLDEATWGTRCGDGSPYAFWLRLAPAGQPAERVVVHMQGGGVCVFGNDCAGVSSGLMRALDNTYPTGGYLSNTNPDSAFRDWTKVYLPYCTQDLHIGGGTTNVFPQRTVHRFGGLNVRAALRYVRDALWAELDATTSEGYRPDRLQVVFGGTSAGAFGVNYNYQYVLDELRWANTLAVPDAGLGLDNGELFGVEGLGLLVFGDSPGIGWSARPLLPPYCHDARCAIGPEIQLAHSERLEAVPGQMVLNVSNQVDDVQVNTTFFASRRSWIDALRAAYCATQGARGLKYFLPAHTNSLHGLVQNSHFPPITSAGTTLGEWLGGAASSPATVADRVEEGTLAAAFGAMPFACPVSP